MKVKTVPDGKVPAKIWVDEIYQVESGCQIQIYNLCKLPFVFHHVAIMPDTHSGYGMPIGGVLATEGVIIPNAVGVDIGCGVISYDTDIPVATISIDDLKIIMGKIRERIPLGKEHKKDNGNKGLMPSMEITDCQVVSRCYDSAIMQLGTLGSGNHFIELQKSSRGTLAVMIHSGSRNLGKQVGDHYNKVAQDLNAAYHVGIPKDWGLAFLPMHTDAGKAYIREMNYCVKFAKVNREIMMSECVRAIREVVTGWQHSTKIYSPLDIAHNYATMENHYGKDVMIHRKGATRARQGELGLIPGSQGTKSYRVEGLGNPESFMSCSHGAGRKMSRSQAREKLNLANEIAKMEAQGIIHGIRSESDLDEAASAYKDIDMVMEWQKDLVKIVDTYTPLAVIKG